MAHGEPGLVVGDDGQRGQALGALDVVVGDGIAEHVGAVAAGDDHLASGRRELGAEPGAHAEAEPAREQPAHEGRGLGELEERKRRSELADHDGVFRLHLVDALRKPGRMNRCLVLDGLDQLAAFGDNLLARGGERLAPALDRGALAFHRVGKGLSQQDHRRERRAAHQEIRLELAERIARLQRIGGDMDDLGILARLVVARHPGHRAVDRDHHVGLGEERAHVVAEMHGMVGRQVHVAGFRLHHRDGELLRQRRQSADRCRDATDARGDDERELGFGDQVSGFLDGGARGLGRKHAERAHGVAPRQGGRACEHFAGQRQIDRSARLAHGDVEGAIHHRFDRLAAAQLVIPLHVFAHHAALVEGLLAPVDRAVPRGDVAGLGDRGAAGGEQYRYVVAGGVDDAVDRVGGADRHVHHDCGRLARHAVVAVRHRHRHVLVRNRHEARGFTILALGKRFHDRGEVRPSVGEDVFNAAFAEPRDVGLRGHAVVELGVGHGVIHPYDGEKGAAR